MRGIIKLFKKKKEEDEFDIEEEFGEDVDLGLEGEKTEEVSFEEQEIEPVPMEPYARAPQHPAYPTQPPSYPPQQPIDLQLLDQKIDMIRFDIQRLSQRIDFLIQRIDYLITLIQQKIYG